MSDPSLISDKTFGKILLFGEYTVLLNGDALAIPLQNSSLSGCLKFDDIEHQNTVWNHWLKYLLGIRNTHLMDLKFNWDTFKIDVEKGLQFDCAIPVGYGLGSSGALTAAVFKRYISDNQWISMKSDLNHLQKTLALFESFFHGSSSGLDPLVSLLNAPIQISGAAITVLPNLSIQRFDSWFLVDSGLPRQTNQLVKIFKDRIQANHHFEEKMLELRTSNYQAIQDFLLNDSGQVAKELSNISRIQFEEMDWLIPEAIKSIWEKGLETDRFYFKLCGAGGGGFFLVHIPEREEQFKLGQQIALIPIISKE